MKIPSTRILLILALTFVTLGLVGPAQGQNRSSDINEFWGDAYRPVPDRFPTIGHRGPPGGPKTTLERLRYWNSIAIDASGLDHTPVAPGEIRTFGEQLGPARASRAEAIVHIAIFDAVNALKNRYESYTGLPANRPSTSADAAIAKAACDTLVALFPSQAATFQQLLAVDLARIPDGPPKDDGIALGANAAAAILAMRAGDGSVHAEPRVGIEFITGTGPGYWRQDPISQIPLALGAYWNTVTPFVMDSAEQFRIPPPPAMNSPEYAAAYNEVKLFGGDGITTPTLRNEDQQFMGIFWAYDGTPSLCAPPRMYNQITTQIAQQKRSDYLETARLLALVNVAMADGGIAAWESKYFYQLWRPITGIREASTDDNPGTIEDPAFMPLGAPATNLTGPNFTPPFPAYPSGHAVFGAALFETLRNFYGTDNVPFTFISDEYNGITVDNHGDIRPVHPRSFTTFSQAEEENGQSRIYLGIHWSFDKTEGIAQGRNVADHVFSNAFSPRN